MVTTGTRRFSLTRKQTRAVTTVTEQVHRITVVYRVSAFRGSDEAAAAACIVLQERTASYTMLTASHRPPAGRSNDGQDVNITWMLQQLSASRQLQFGVDRSGAACKTPRRNPEIAAAVGALSQLERWAEAVSAAVQRVCVAMVGRQQPPPKLCGTGGHLSRRRDCHLLASPLRPY